MTYCFMKYRQTGDDQPLAPDCPDGITHLLLATLPRLGWGIFAVDPGDTWSPEELVSGEIAKLIESARRYPPALALAREEMEDVFGENGPSQGEFARAYGVALRTHLARQYEAPYVLAPALPDEAGHLAKGEWYWILGISGTPSTASWVSDDFHIYSNDVNDFDLTGQQLKRLGYSG